jgi:hypothetical protein
VAVEVWQLKREGGNTDLMTQHRLSPGTRSLRLTVPSAEEEAVPSCDRVLSKKQRTVTGLSIDTLLM